MSSVESGSEKGGGGGGAQERQETQIKEMGEALNEGTKALRGGKCHLKECGTQEKQPFFAR